MRRQKTQSPVTHTPVKNTRRKPDTALKRRKMRTTCRSKILTRISTGRWGLVTMKKKKAVGRNKRMKRETDLRTEVAADLEKGMVTIAIVTSPSTTLTLTKERGVRGEAGAEVQRNLKKNLSTDESMSGRRRVPEKQMFRLC